MNVPPVIATFQCANCGARSQSPTGKCWLCLENKVTSNPYTVTTKTTENAMPAPSNWDGVFGILLLLCFLLTVLVAIGIAVQDRGMLIPFAIFVGPAYLVTIVRGLVQTRSQDGPRAGSLFLTFMLSLMVTVAVLIMLAVAGIIFLFIICLQSMNR